MVNRQLMNGQNGEAFVEESGLKGQQAISPGQRPRDGCVQIKDAPKGQKQFNPNDAFALTGRHKHSIPFPPGHCPGL